LDNAHGFRSRKGVRTQQAAFARNDVRSSRKKEKPVRKIASILESENGDGIKFLSY